jgi:hypothetical protein
MKKLFTSTLLTVAAVPFLMAAPAAKKVQNQPTSGETTQTTTVKKTHKKHVKKAKGTDTAAAPTSAPQK